jgi:hypothetical protein
MQRSSELIVSLCGMDASEHMMELVFGDFEREYASTGMGLRPSSSSLGFAMSSMVRRVMPPLGRGGASSPARSAVSGMRPMSRAGGSFTSRLHSGFMSLLSSREQFNGEVARAGEALGGSFTSVSSVGRGMGGYTAR